MKNPPGGHSLPEIPEDSLRENNSLFNIKNPKTTPFEQVSPPGCVRNCKQFFQAHSKDLSFALYSHPSRGSTICIYAFSCGNEIQGEKYDIPPGETIRQTVEKIVPVLVTQLQRLAVHEKHIQVEDYGQYCDN